MNLVSRVAGKDVSFGHGYNSGLPHGLELDTNRCREIAIGLVSAYHSLGLASTIPEVRYSTQFLNDPLNLRRFLILSSAQDSMKPSRHIYSNGRDMFLEHGYNKLRSLRKRNNKELADIAHNYFYKSGIRDSAQILKSCIDVIETYYDGDPINIFKDTKDLTKIRKRLMQIHGIGPYVSSLIVKNFVRFGFFEPENKNAIPIKIDRHAIRITVENKGLVFSEPTSADGIHRSKISSTLERTYSNITVSESIDPIVLDDAKWSVGAHILADYDIGILKSYGLDFIPKIYFKGRNIFDMAAGFTRVASF